MCVIIFYSFLLLYIKPYDVHHKPRLDTEKLRPPAFHEAGNVGVVMAMTREAMEIPVKSWDKWWDFHGISMEFWWLNVINAIFYNHHEP